MPDSNYLPELTFIGIEDGQVALRWKKTHFLGQENRPVRSIQKGDDFERGLLQL